MDLDPIKTYKTSTLTGWFIGPLSVHLAGDGSMTSVADVARVGDLGVGSVGTLS